MRKKLTDWRLYDIPEDKFPIPFKKPTLEDFGLNEKDVREIYERKKQSHMRMRVFLFLICFSLLLWATNYNSNKNFFIMLVHLLFRF